MPHYLSQKELFRSYFWTEKPLLLPVIPVTALSSLRSDNLRHALGPLTFWGTPTIQDRGPLGNLLVPGGPDEHSWLLYLSSLVSWLGRVDPCLVEGSDASLIAPPMEKSHV